MVPGPKLQGISRRCPSQSSQGGSVDADSSCGGSKPGFEQVESCRGTARDAAKLIEVWIVAQTIFENHPQAAAAAFPAAAAPMAAATAAAAECDGRTKEGGDALSPAEALGRGTGTPRKPCPQRRGKGQGELSGSGFCSARGDFGTHSRGRAAVLLLQNGGRREFIARPATIVTSKKSVKGTQRLWSRTTLTRRTQACRKSLISLIQLICIFLDMALINARSRYCRKGNNRSFGTRGVLAPFDAFASLSLFERAHAR